MSNRFLRLPEILTLNGNGKAKQYGLIQRGLYPPPAKYGKTSVWPEREDEIVRAAIISGKSDDELREIVKELMAARAGAFDRARAEAHTTQAA